MTWIALTLAGGLGAVCRYVAGPTWRVNLAGAFALGILAGIAPDPDLLRVAAVGFLGSFTTFSTLLVEARNAEPWRVLGLQFAAGLVLVEAGIRLGGAL
jgi:fluoride exporter